MSEYTSILCVRFDGSEYREKSEPYGMPYLVWSRLNQRWLTHDERLTTNLLGAKALTLEGARERCVYLNAHHRWKMERLAPMPIVDALKREAEFEDPGNASDAIVLMFVHHRTVEAQEFLDGATAARDRGASIAELENLTLRMGELLEAHDPAIIRWQSRMERIRAGIRAERLVDDVY